MARFLFLQRGGCDERPEMSPEQMQEAMQGWMDWVKQGTEAGWLIDPGSPLAAGAAVVQSDETIIDGPFTESKELVGGYSIVEAPDLAAACELAQQTIKLAGGGQIEVRECRQGG